MTSLLDDGEAVGVVYSDLCQAFNTLSYNILTAKLVKYGLDKWTGEWTENQLNFQVQRVVNSNTTPIWRPVIRGVP